jgi:hypothetical protein
MSKDYCVKGIVQMFQRATQTEIYVFGFSDMGQSSCYRISFGSPPGGRVGVSPESLRLAAELVMLSMRMIKIAEEIMQKQRAGLDFSPELQRVRSENVQRFEEG